MKEAYNLIQQKKWVPLLLLLFILGNMAYSQPEKVMINEINYRSINIQKNIDFIELYNTGTIPVDLTGWQITDGVTYQFPAGIKINAGAYLVIAADPPSCQFEFNFRGVLGPYAGQLSNDGENIALRDQDFSKIDEVAYKSWQEWPAVRFINDGDAPASIQKIHPDLPSNQGGSWDSGIPTPKAANADISIANANDIPIIKSVSRKPNSPDAGEEVRIKADLTNIDDLSGTLSLELEYQIVEPGNYVHKSDSSYANNWIAIPMLDNGVDADATADNGTYTAAIPADVQTHRRLIRYRIKISTSTGYTNTYPDQNHIESNYAYYIYNAYPLVGDYDINTLDPMQEITVITGKETADKYIGPGNGRNNTGQYAGSDYLGEGTLIYDGKVYDHIRFRPRGKENGRGDRFKPALKFDLNAAHTFAQLDGCGEEQEEERGKLTLSGTYVNDIATHGFTESLIHQVIGLMGAMDREPAYTQFRIVDEQEEQGDFWGVFMILEGYDKAYLKKNNHPEGNIWRHKALRLIYQGDFPNTFGIGKWNLDMTAVDWDLLLADKAANVFLGNGAWNYEGKHSQRDYYNSKTGKWHIWYGDYDTAFGMSYDNGTYHKRSSSEYDKGIDLVQDLSGKEEEFKNVMRSAYDLLFNEEQLRFLIDTEAAKIRNPAAAYDWTNVDKYRWKQKYDLGSIDAHIDWYRTWFQNRSNFLLNNEEHGFENLTIPNTPVISLTGTGALDDLTFSNSPFSAPDTSTFAALEWRVGEWSDPANPIYQDICEPKYEIQTVWKSGPITAFSNNFTIPGTAKLTQGRTYKIRVRYKDNAGTWSHWSDAVQMIPTATQDDTVPALVINEIMYNPSEKCGSEFIEIKNATTDTIALHGVAFTDGIAYEFPKGATIAPNSLIVLAKDSLTFYQKYGFYPFGDYSGSLDNKGERLELSGLYNRIIDTLTYDNKTPWDEKADGKGSLALQNTSLDNAKATSWCHSDSKCGTPGSENDGVCNSITFDCQDLAGNIGDTCDDKDASTENDEIQADCSCAGTLINTGNMTTATCDGNTSITYGDGSIQMDGLEDSEYFFQIFDASWQEVFDCIWQCGTSQTVTGLSTGEYRVVIKDSNYQIICVKDIALIPNANDPDKDKDGLPASEDCDDNDANLTTIGAICNDGDLSTKEDVVQADCSCAGTPISLSDNTTESCTANTSITYGNGTIQMDGLVDLEYFFQVFTASWQEVFNCGWECGTSKTLTGLPAGGYRVFIKDKDYKIICMKDITLDAGIINTNDPDEDKDGIPASEDCNDKDANLTLTGAACDDANPATENDVVQADCTCAGAPITTSEGSDKTATCGESTITYGNGTIAIKGIIGKQYFFKIKDLNDGWIQVGGCSADCGYEFEKTGLANSRYLITVYDTSWAKLCDTELEMTATSISAEASSRSVFGKQKVNFNFGLEAIDVFPNPAKKELFINLPAQEGRGAVKIVNLFGQVMHGMHTEQVLEDLMRLDISQLEKGFYHVVIEVEGMQPVTRKVLVE